MSVQRDMDAIRHLAQHALEGEISEEGALAAIRDIAEAHSDEPSPDLSAAALHDFYRRAVG